MKKIMYAALVLVASSGIAMAEPMRLDSAQMDGVTAGLLDNLQVNVGINTQAVTTTSVPIAIGRNARADNNDVNVRAIQTNNQLNARFQRSFNRARLADRVF